MYVAGVPYIIHQRVLTLDLNVICNTSFILFVCCFFFFFFFFVVVFFFLTGKELFTRL